MPNYHIIKISERYLWSKSIQDRTTDVWAVYAFDRNAATNLCEITPSFCLMYLGACHEPILGLTDKQLEVLHEDVDEGSDATDPVSYMHVGTIEALITKYRDLVKKVEMVLDTEDCSSDNERWNAEFDQLREGWQTGALSF